MIKAVLNREPRLSEAKIRSSVFGLQAEVLAGIYQEEINIAIWKRELTPDIAHSSNFILKKNPNLKLSVTASPKNVSKILEETIGSEGRVVVGSGRGIQICHDVLLIGAVVAGLFAHHAA